MMMDKPNLVYITADQLKASAAPILGNPLISCPFMERLAAEGITFPETYAASTICTPSRASVFTGVHPLVHQVTCWQNKAPLNLPQMSELFASAGYYTAVSGHFEQGRNLSRGWYEQVDLREPGPLARALETKYSHGRKDVGWSCGAIDCSPDEGHSALLADRSIRMIDTARRSRMPFFLHFSFNDPHPSYYVPPPYDSMVDPDRVDLPVMDHDGARPAWQEQALEEVRTGEASELDLKKVVAVYNGMIRYVDDQMNRVFRALGERDLLENTWVIFASDHGDFMGEKGLFEKCEVPYECLTHVPLVIRPPTKLTARRGIRIPGLVDLVDLFPTFLSMGGIPVPEYAQGHDLMDWVGRGARRPLRCVAFAQVGDYHGHLKSTFPTGTFNSGRRNALVRAGRSREFSYIRDPQYGDEAYDLTRDPRELDNLLHRGPVSDGVSQLRDEVDRWEEACLDLRKQLNIIPGDRGFEPGWE